MAVLKGITLRKCVFDVCLWFDFNGSKQVSNLAVLIWQIWLEKGYTYEERFDTCVCLWQSQIWKFWYVHLLMTESDLNVLIRASAYDRVRSERFDTRICRVRSESFDTCICLWQSLIVLRWPCAHKTDKFKTKRTKYSWTAGLTYFQLIKA